MALLMCLFALLLLSAVGLGLMFMSDTETSINSNYRSSQQAYYGSKAGLEEMGDRLRWGNSTSIRVPTVMPSTSSTAGVTYILNSDGGTAVKPWDPANPHFDDELCHENFNSLGLPADTGYPLQRGPERDVLQHRHQPRSQYRYRGRNAIQMGSADAQAEWHR